MNQALGQQELWAKEQSPVGREVAGWGLLHQGLFLGWIQG